MTETQCPACGAEVAFQAVEYGRSHQHVQGFWCRQCDGMGLRMSETRLIPCIEVSYPVLIPFGAVERVQFVLEEAQCDSYTFVSGKHQHLLSRTLLDQLREPDLVGYFH